MDNTDRFCLQLLKPDFYDGVDREAVSWFREILPRLIRDHPSVASSRYDFVQRPGETVFVPGNWWHVVLNLDTTVAVTQNFASASNFRVVWPCTVKSRPRLAARWLTKLSEAAVQHRSKVTKRCEAQAGAVEGVAITEASAMETEARKYETLVREAHAMVSSMDGATHALYQDCGQIHGSDRGHVEEPELQLSRLPSEMQLRRWLVDQRHKVCALALLNSQCALTCRLSNRVFHPAAQARQERAQETGAECTQESAHALILRAT
eukprot:SAG11_NODE_485_length_9035_cov_16.221352_9_plen_264_part_00